MENTLCIIDLYRYVYNSLYFHYCIYGYIDHSYVLILPDSNVNMITTRAVFI